jgi:hypothetical protein
MEKPPKKPIRKRLTVELYQVQYKLLEQLVETRGETEKRVLSGAIKLFYYFLNQAKNGRTPAVVTQSEPGTESKVAAMFIDKDLRRIAGEVQKKTPQSTPDSTSESSPT